MLRVHFTFPVASDVGARVGATDAGCTPIAAKTIETKRSKRITAVLTVSRLVSAARPESHLSGEAAEPA
jgi:hypothetical protein